MPLHPHLRTVPRDVKGPVFISKKHIGKIFELLEQDDMERIGDFSTADLAEELPAADFKDNFKRDLD